VSNALRKYHYARKHWKMFRMALIGEASWYLFVVALGFVNLPATLVVFVAPFVLCRFLMMAGNWTQHAFLDLADPANPYRNSLTTINTRYNRRCFNDGYHIGHHVKANRHWTEMPDDFLANVATYRDQGAVVIDGLDYFQIWALLMLKRYKTLAAHYVDLGATRRSEAEIITLLRERTRHTTRGAPARLGARVSGRTVGHAPL
jgi:fatty acid desaturase